MALQNFEYFFQLSGRYGYGRYKGPFVSFPTYKPKPKPNHNHNCNPKFLVSSHSKEGIVVV